MMLYLHLHGSNHGWAKKFNYLINCLLVACNVDGQNVSRDEMDSILRELYNFRQDMVDMEVDMMGIMHQSMVATPSLNMDTTVMANAEGLLVALYCKPGE